MRIAFAFLFAGQAYDCLMYIRRLLHYPLYGQIEMLSINGNYSSMATLTSLKSKLELSNKTTGYNEFGMLVSSIVKTNQKEIMRKTITYKSKPGSTTNKSLDIASEDNFYYGKGTITRAYETDNLGRITKVTDSLFGNHTYSYDEKGYLKSEDTTSFSYDTNGNITQAGTKIYEYSGTIKDRLTKALGYKVDYIDSLNPGNPTSWNNKTYGWDRSRRLVKFKKDQIETEYTYNAEGLRTSKTHQGVTTDYYYSKDRLILEKTPSYKLNFLYDENGLLYGFIKDNSTKYFYIRDVYQNILGIIDIEGTIVVKYDCDVWGNHRVLDGNGNENTSASFIGNINPFRYKGYYYDQESNMYYCKSRYYVPKWCRWLNADSISYLNPHNIHELNLFVYCKNNPVMYVDPSGQFPWLIALAVLLLTPIGGTLTQVAVSTVSYVGIAVASIFNEDIRNDMNAIGWNPFNSKEDLVLNSSNVSFYKGMAVYRTNFDRSGTFYAMFLKRNSSIDEIRHERGHGWQSMMMGIATYGFTVGIPSPMKLGKWDKEGNYYGAPWETMADILGGAKGWTHSNAEIRNAWGYYAVSILYFPLTALYWL